VVYMQSAAHSVAGMQTHEKLRRPHVFSVRVAVLASAALVSFLGAANLSLLLFVCGGAKASPLLVRLGRRGRGKGCRRCSISHRHCGGDAVHGCDLEEVSQGELACLAH